MTQLKVMQECSTLVVFTVVAFVLFRSPLKWNCLVSYALIVGTVLCFSQVLARSALTTEGGIFSQPAIVGMRLDNCSLSGARSADAFLFQSKGEKRS